jgi:hypothetical protein
MLDIIRREHNAFETVGFLKFNLKRIGFVLEPPWLNNMKCVSCIPEGEYICTRFASTRFGGTWAIPVEGRTNIVFHWGNSIIDTLGCPLVGFDIGWLKGRRAVLDSRKCHKELMDRTRHLEELKLTIINAWSY